MSFFYPLFLVWLVLCTPSLLVHGRPASFRSHSSASMRKAIERADKQIWKEPNAIPDRLPSAILDEESLKTLPDENLSFFRNGRQKNTDGLSRLSKWCNFGSLKEDSRVLSGKAGTRRPCFPIWSGRPYFIFPFVNTFGARFIATTSMSENVDRGGTFSKPRPIAVVVYVIASRANRAEVVQKAMKKLKRRTSFNGLCVDRSSVKVVRVSARQYRVLFRFQRACSEPEITPASMYT